MASDRLMTIGSFALVTGLSIPTLRHYADVGLLAPASVDPDSGYRLYTRSQARDARMIRALRAIDLPLDQVRELVRDGDEATTRAVLLAHRAELAGSADALAEMLCRIDNHIERGTAMPVAEGKRVVQVTIGAQDRDASVAFYEQVFDIRYDEQLASFAFGAYPGDDFFLVTLEDRGQATPARFGLTVDDLDAVHARALAAGAREVQPPEEFEWKPRCSCVTDPSGNLLDLYER
jgi:DNA-binding transcriptional MerR regulator